MWLSIRPLSVILSMILRGALLGLVVTTTLFVSTTLLGCRPQTAERESPRRPNVILISIDTLRADHLGAYGYETRPTSPNLDALAEDGAIFLDASSQAPWTTPSHMSIFTSLLPSTHGLLRDWDVALDFMLGRGTYPALPASVPTLAELLRDAGYCTLAQVGGGTMSADFGFDRGFDVYRETGDVLEWRAHDEAVDSLRQLLDRRLENPAGTCDDAPFFLFFHTFEVHAPYQDLRWADPYLDPQQVEALAELQAQNLEEPIQAERDFLRRHGLMRPDVLSALYDGGIRSVDERLGRFFDLLQEEDLWDDTLIIVTSDHGEQLGEREPRYLGDHGQSLYQEMVHVPLIFHGAVLEIDEDRIETPVALLDIAPTILDLVGAEIPTSFEGRSLVPLLRGRTWHDERDIYAEGVVIRPEQKMLRRGDLKLIGSFSLPGERRTLDSEEPRRHLSALRLFDLEDDPAETLDLRGSGEAESRDLPLAEMTDDLLEGFAEAAAAQREGGESEVEVDDETLRKLRALGYID